MKKTIQTTVLAVLFAAASSHAGFGIGADVVSRYVWRGTDFGNSAAIQPALSFKAGNFEIGAWASYALADEGADENDLYISWSLGSLGLTLTDYYFPQTRDFFNYRDRDSVHFIETAVSWDLGRWSLLCGYFFSGDPDRSLYAEAAYEVLSGDASSAVLTAGAGNGLYMTGDDFSVVQIGLTVTKGSLSASYLLNPDVGISSLVFGFGF